MLVNPVHGRYVQQRLFFNIQGSTNVPEPGSYLMMGLGLFTVMRRRQSR
jgi:hypothetical protein